MKDIPQPLSAINSNFITELTTFIRMRGLSYSTEKTYVHWIKRYINFCGYQSRHDISSADINRFLEHLVIKKNVSPNTQKKQHSMRLFFFVESISNKTPNPLNTKGLKKRP